MKLFSDLPLEERIRRAREHVARPDSDYEYEQKEKMWMNEERF